MNATATDDYSAILRHAALARDPSVRFVYGGTIRLGADGRWTAHAADESVIGVFRNQGDAGWAVGFHGRTGWRQ